MRVCVAVRVYPAASEGFVVDQVQRLVAAGHEVDLLAIYDGSDPPPLDAGHLPAPRYLVGERGTFRKALLRLGYRAAWAAVRRPIPFLRSAGRYRPGLLWPLESIHALRPVHDLWGTRYDVIHAHFGPTANLMHWLRELGAVRGPLLSTFHGFDATVLPGADPNGDYGRLFASGERFTTNTAFLRGRLIDLGAPAESVDVLPVGIDPGRFTFGEDRPSSTPARLLTVARLVECKGIHYALLAVQRLAWERPGVRYTIIGDGPMRARLEHLTRMLGLEGHVDFLGALPYNRVLEAYAAHDVFLLTGVEAENGQVEAQGRVLLEAQAAGLMVVASDIGGISEVVAPGAGILVAPGRDEAIVRALRLLLDTPEEWPHRAREGRAFVESRFDDAVLYQRLLRIYRELAGDQNLAPDP